MKRLSPLSRSRHDVQDDTGRRSRIVLALTVCASAALVMVPAGPLFAQQFGGSDHSTTSGGAPATNITTTQPPEILPLPQWTSTTVNDFAGLLTPDDARALDVELTRLQQETGIEGTVVTLHDRASYGGTDGLEPFATRLFNHWGVGDPARNNGFMVLVLRDDGEARIELGSGYPGDADIPAQDIMRNVILPDMRQGTPSAAIRNGTEAIITIIAEPHASGQKIARSASGRDGRDLLGGAIATLLLILGGTSILRGIWRRKRCPECGRWGLREERESLRQDLPEGGWQTSENTHIRRCPACGWQTARTVAAPFVTQFGPDGRMVSRSRNPSAPQGLRGRSGFGGGSSRGGGASGRW